jgi:hypothetical protein
VRDLAGQLAALWRELERHEAVVNRVPLDSPDAVLQARITHESKRLRALGEREAS